MLGIRIMAAAATMVAALAFTPIAAAAGPCAPGEAACAQAKAAAPLRLDQFTKRKKAGAVVQRKEKTSVSRKVTAAAAADAADASGEAHDTKVGLEPDVGPVKTIETEGVAVTSAEEWNEIDAAADQVQVVVASELNEIDLTADTAAPARDETVGTGSMASADVPQRDISWIGKLLLAFGGTITVAGVLRFLLVA